MITHIETEGRRIRAVILKPGASRRPLNETPGILWIHGGGYQAGFPEMIYASRARNLVRKYGAVAVSPDYRKSGKAPYPAALEDCYAALVYMHDHAEELGFNRDLIFVGGESAGGGLTAALCLYARDKGEVKIRYQMPLYPMLDCEDTASSADNHGYFWDTRRNHRAWKKYLRGIQAPFPYYASPSRCEDYTGLPPAYTFVGDGEPFRDEAIAYIQNLQKAGIEARVDVYHSKAHAFDMLLPWMAKSREAAKRFDQQYEKTVKEVLEELV